MAWRKRVRGAAVAVFLAAGLGCGHSGSPRGPGGVPPAPPPARQPAPSRDLEPPPPDPGRPQQELAPPPFSLSRQNAPISPAPPPAVTMPERRACIDSELQRRHLNAYGDPLGTTYANANPLLDERTGDTVDRYDRVLKLHPEIGAVCIRTITPP